MFFETSSLQFIICFKKNVLILNGMSVMLRIENNAIVCTLQSFLQCQLLPWTHRFVWSAAMFATVSSQPWLMGLKVHLFTERGEVNKVRYAEKTEEMIVIGSIYSALLCADGFDPGL